MHTFNKNESLKQSAYMLKAFIHENYDIQFAFEMYFHEECSFF